MSNIEIFLIAVSLSCDAFAVAFSKGISICNLKLKHTLIIGTYFGFFQALMPLIGYSLSSSLSIYLIRYSHLIGFIILSIIGVSMYKEGSCEENELCDFKTMIPLSIGTSIDALAVGITFPMMVTNVFSSCLIIGLTTFILCSLATILASKIKDKIDLPSKKIGGIILILLALKMLFEFLF